MYQKKVKEDLRKRVVEEVREKLEKLENLDVNIRFFLRMLYIVYKIPIFIFHK